MNPEHLRRSGSDVVCACTYRDIIDYELSAVQWISGWFFETHQFHLSCVLSCCRISVKLLMYNYC